jgi:poly(hydroxyalkanoate) depolymerase family esterase
MNWVAQFFDAHDAFWSTLMPGFSASETCFVDADSAASATRSLERSENVETSGSEFVVGVNERMSEPPIPMMPPTTDARTTTLSCGDGPKPTPGVSHWSSRRFEHKGQSHQAKVFLPSSYVGRPLPMVVMLHGAQQNPDDFAAGTQMNQMAEKAGIIVVYPEQSESNNLIRCWDWYKASNHLRDSGDTAMLAALTCELIAEVNADGNRVYVAGMSAGGAMAINLAVLYPDIYAAAAVHSGIAFGVADDYVSALCAMNDGRGRIRLPKVTSNPHPSRRAPMIVFHGDADDTVHPRNSGQIVEMSHLLRGQEKAAPSPTSMRVEADHDHYAYSRYLWEEDGLPLAEQWVVHGLGHAWSGGHPDGTYTDQKGPNASIEIVRFFSQFSLERAETCADAT